jgi:glycosyltransferase involved in cell wall biosynthesis
MERTVVGIDGRAARQGLGIGRVLAELVPRLAARPELEVVFLGPPSLAPPGVRVLWPPALRAAYPALDGPPGRWVAARAGVQVMHFTANSGWMTAGRVPFVLTVHDLIFRERRADRTPRQRLGHRYQTLNARRAIRAAAAVAVPSAAVADEVAAWTGRRPEVIANGVAPCVPGESPVAGRYVLAFGGRDPRKRLDLAVAGWRAAGTGARLVVAAGAGLPDIALGDDVLVLPYLERSRLDALIAGAEALVYPSEHEGFGLPVVEALALGTPVVTGLCRATREVGGDAVLEIAADDPVASIGHALRRLPGVREALVARGLQRARSFSWDAAADRYAALYRAARR